MLYLFPLWSFNLIRILAYTIYAYQKHTSSSPRKNFYFSSLPRNDLACAHSSLHYNRLIFFVGIISCWISRVRIRTRLSTITKATTITEIPNKNQGKPYNNSAYRSDGWKILNNTQRRMIACSRSLLCIRLLHIKIISLCAQNQRRQRKSLTFSLAGIN